MSTPSIGSLKEAVVMLLARRDHAAVAMAVFDAAQRDVVPHLNAVIEAAIRDRFPGHAFVFHPIMRTVHAHCFGPTFHVGSIDGWCPVVPTRCGGAHYWFNSGLYQAGRYAECVTLVDRGPLDGDAFEAFLRDMAAMIGVKIQLLYESDLPAAVVIPSGEETP